MEVFSFERRIKNYSNYQNILLVGEGDFSFAICLARAFDFAANMVATSRDTRESLMVEYSKAMSNVEELESRECTVLHEVDVHYMSKHPCLINVRFDRIIYNFPHAGYLKGSRSCEREMYQIWYHQDLVRGFFENAREMLTRVGEIHVTHKTTYPFSEWNIVDLACQAGLILVHKEPFSKWDYPGYENKRGAGMFDQTFPVGMCSTYKFAKMLDHSTTSGFHLGTTSSGPWPRYCGIWGPHMEL
ncbi:hypothetical protein D8674_043096 [Pyrus ussuriensis x Pyrus communis]|uniref:25S rRNA (uridine-N(3))-methyltransferase BMT5-like domain-containing protein n=1 Tax=Pyrus ussuriensis x Pyrus communis TaxID=2448454 RepID=A0A5N5IAZ6_9ROSA|nr:hypothetical protein D8674_043096 [Pyrus ussuriensis x Pyrus communis]